MLLQGAASILRSAFKHDAVKLVPRGSGPGRLVGYHNSKLER